MLVLKYLVRPGRFAKACFSPLSNFHIIRMSSSLGLSSGEIACTPAEGNVAESDRKSLHGTHSVQTEENRTVSVGECTMEVDKIIKIDTTPYTIVTEGKAEVLFPSTHDVFYNPVQEFNRDLSVAVLKQFLKMIPDMDQGKYRKRSIGKNHCEEVHVLEALAASGLRSIRYAKEVPGLRKVVANDMSSQAYESIERNIKHNKVEHIVMSSKDEAAILMYKHRNFKSRFDVIDLDPYGTASPFLDAAVQSVADGGLLMVTSTDTAVLCGKSPAVCHAKYGATPVVAYYCHEMALRILLQSIESHANRYGRYIEPLISLSVDFYVRVFVQIFTGPVMVKKSFCKFGMLYDCTGCSSFYVQPIGKHVETEKGEKYVPATGPPVGTICENCGQKYKIGGPLWIARMHNKEFVQKMIGQVEEEPEKYKTSKRILGVLNVILEELDDCPLYYRLDKMCHIVHVPTPSSLQFRSAILNAGYRVSLSHASPNSVKTDASPDVIWDIIKTWVKLNPGKRSFELEPSKTILNKEPSTQVSFELHPDANPESRAKSLVRFQLNPQPFWGPKRRATTSLWTYKDDEKRKSNQSKRKRQQQKNEKDLKQFLCKKFKENECDKGDECQYSHEDTAKN